jgi:hypothetical protein
MRNGRVYRCTLAVTTISAIMLIATTTTSLVTIGNALEGLTAADMNLN